MNYVSTKFGKKMRGKKKLKDTIVNKASAYSKHTHTHNHSQEAQYFANFNSKIKNKNLSQF